MPGDLKTVFDLLSHPGFLTGLSAGLIGAAVYAGVAVALGRRLHGLALLLTITVVVGLAIRYGFDPVLGGLLAALAGAGLLVDLAHAFGRGRLGLGLRVAAWVLAVAAAAWFGIEVGAGHPIWVSYGLPVAMLALASGLWLAGRHAIAEMAGPMLALVVAGTWVTVPETDQLTVLVGAVIPFGLLTLRPVQARASMAGAMAFAGLFGWLSIAGGSTRPWTVVAAWAAGAGILLVAGASWMRERRPRRLLVLLVHLVFVAAITRVADYTDSEVVVFVWLILLVAVAGLAVVLAPGTREEIDSHS